MDHTTLDTDTDDLLAEGAAMDRQAQRELAVQERYQRRIARALEQAGA
jgi:hypothetical protein